MDNPNVEAEVRSLLRYIGAFDTNIPIDNDMVDRYLKALDRHGLTATPLLDPIVRRSRFLLGAVDAVSHIFFPGNLLQKKLLIAAAIVECDPRSVETLLPRKRSRILIFFSLIGLTLRIVLTWIIALPLLLLPSFLKRNAGAA